MAPGPGGSLPRRPLSHSLAHHQGRSELPLQPTPNPGSEPTPNRWGEHQRPRNHSTMAHAAPPAATSLCWDWRECLADSLGFFYFCGSDSFCWQLCACVQHYSTFCLASSLRSDQLPIQKAHFRSDINRSVLVSSFFLVSRLNVFPWIASSFSPHDVSC